jgi:hypothetical protein
VLTNCKIFTVNAVSMHLNLKRCTQLYQVLSAFPYLQSLIWHFSLFIVTQNI